MPKKPTKFAGTLCAEIIKPTNVSWDELSQRLHALRRTLAEALNETQSELYPEGMALLKKLRAKQPGTKAARKDLSSYKVEQKLREYWIAALKRHNVYAEKSHEARETQRAEEEAEQGKEYKKKPRYKSACLPVARYITGESADYIASRWTGEHLRDLMALRARIPHFSLGPAMWIRADCCEIDTDDPSEPALRIQLWPNGRAAHLKIALCGAGHWALWRQLVRDETRRRDARDQRDARENQLKKEKNTKELDPQWLALNRLYENSPGYKLGRIGIKYDPKKRKWFVLISWTRPLVEPMTGGQKAAVNLGIHTAFRAVAEDGSTYRIKGEDLIGARRKFQARRGRLQANLGHLGVGSSGHGKARKHRAVRDLEERETNFAQTWIRQRVREVMDWCYEHDITELYLEDTSGIRDEFEQKTSGEADEEVKRFIHNFPHYFWKIAISRAAQTPSFKWRKAGKGPIRVEFHPFRYQSQKCPDTNCAYTSPDNVSYRPERFPAEVYVAPDTKKVFYRTAKIAHFCCQACGWEADGDLVAATNNLLAVGGTFPKSAFYRTKKNPVADTIATQLNAE